MLSVILLLAQLIAQHTFPTRQLLAIPAGTGCAFPGTQRTRFWLARVAWVLQSCSFALFALFAATRVAASVCT